MISVIMPVYNTSEYLDQAVESILRQTYEDWELIIIDDGSNDDSGLKCDSYTRKDSRIKVIHQLNSGISAVRNTGLEIAEGEYLQFLDSDDWLDENAFEILLSSSYETGADMVMFDAMFEFKDYSYHEQSALAAEIHDCSEVLIKLCEPSIPPYVWNKFCRRELYDGVFFPEGELWEDAATTFFPVSRADKIAVLDKPLYHYRQRPGALTDTAQSEGKIPKWRFIQYRKRYEYLKDSFPEAAAAGRDSIIRNGIIYYSILPKDDELKRDIYEYLSSPEFSNNIRSPRLRKAEAAFRLFPNLTSHITGLYLKHRQK